MGRIDYEDQLRAAARYKAAVARQKALTDDKGQSDAVMLDRRRDFMLASQRVFFESIIEGSDLLPIRYLAMGEIAARAVGRIHIPPADGRGSGFATGFLVAPGLLLTNHHVLPTAAAARSATVTMDAQDGVDGLPATPRVYTLEPRRAFIADATLDFAIVAVSPRATDGTPLASYGWLRLQESTGKIARDEYATIIQHPNGRQKHIAARNNQVRVYVYDHDLSEAEQAANAFLYYSTDTLPGSSGSPVLSDQWYVVALHRRGVPKTRLVRGQPVILRRNGKVAADDDPEEVIAYESNEGVRISHLIARLDALGASDAPGSDADRAMAQSIRQRIRAAAGALTDGPVATITRTYTAIAGPRDAAPGADASLEVVRRKRTLFPEDAGYDAHFLPGHVVPLPTLDQALQLEVAPRTDGKPGPWLPFRHFSTVMHARRRMPVLAAVNISLADKPAGGMPQRPQWSYDPRIAEEHQPDDTIFSSEVQRGHLAAREYIYWGASDDEVHEADVHSFTLTNACPQVDAFNGQNGEWFQLERLVVAASKDASLRLTEFTGPIFRVDDPEFDAVRAPSNDAERGTLIRIPLRFWKVIFWVEKGRLRNRAFILDQRDELDAAAEDGGGLELDIVAPQGVKRTTLKRIGELTGVRFG